MHIIVGMNIIVLHPLNNPHSGSSCDNDGGVDPLFSLLSPSPSLLSPPAFPVPCITPVALNPVVLDTSINLTCSSYGLAPFNLTWSVNGSVVASAVHVDDSLTFTVDLVSTDSYTS